LAAAAGLALVFAAPLSQTTRSCSGAVYRQRRHLRTVVDLGGRDPLIEGVVAADLFLHAALVTVAELRTYVAEHPGAKGVARLRRVVELAEPKAESAMETRLRMLLVLAGLPPAEVQVSIHDDQGRFLGRPDLLYRLQGLAIEYDGGTHRDRLVEDNRRQNGLIGAGLRLLRFTAADVYGNPDLVALQVRHALSARPTIDPEFRHSGTDGRIPGREFIQLRTNGSNG
jgi:hypothetical protein